MILLSVKIPQQKNPRYLWDREHVPLRQTQLVYLKDSNAAAHCVDSDTIYVVIYLRIPSLDL